MATGRNGDVAALMEAMSDPTRVAVVELLSRAPCRAGVLADRIGTTPPTMSKHLRILLEVGLVSDERDPADARARIFRLQPERVMAVRAWLDQLQAHWNEQLGAFKRHAEKRSRR